MDAVTENSLPFRRMRRLRLVWGTAAGIGGWKLR